VIKNLPLVNNIFRYLNVAKWPNLLYLADNEHAVQPTFTHNKLFRLSNIQLGFTRNGESKKHRSEFQP
jgi:hypothetical protein